MSETFLPYILPVISVGHLIHIVGLGLLVPVVACSILSLLFVANITVFSNSSTGENSVDEEWGMA